MQEKYEFSRHSVDECVCLQVMSGYLQLMDTLTAGRPSLVVIHCVSKNNMT